MNCSFSASLLWRVRPFVSLFACLFDCLFVGLGFFPLIILSVPTFCLFASSLVRLFCFCSFVRLFSSDAPLIFRFRLFCFHGMSAYRSVMLFLFFYL